jgi:hypothetical protein
MAQYYCHTCARTVQATEQLACSVCGNDFLEAVGPDLFQGVGAAESVQTQNQNSLPQQQQQQGQQQQQQQQGQQQQNPFQAMINAMMGGNAPPVVVNNNEFFQGFFGAQNGGADGQPRVVQINNPAALLQGLFGFAQQQANNQQDNGEDGDEEAEPIVEENHQQQPQPQQQQEQQPQHNHLNRIQQMLNDMVLSFSFPYLCFFLICFSGSKYGRCSSACCSGEQSARIVWWSLQFDGSKYDGKQQCGRFCRRCEFSKCVESIV